MRKVYLFTLSYPYGKGEKTFITPELHQMLKEFDVTVLSCASKKQIRETEYITKLDSSVSIIQLRDYLNGKEKFRYLIQALCSPIFWRELYFIKKDRKKLYQCFYYTLSFFVRAIHIKKQVEQLGILDEESIFYTYWYNYCTLGLAMVKKKKKNLKIITRTHGYDLYQERCPGNWQPFKHYMTKKVNAVFFACDGGRNYYINTYIKNSLLEDKLFLSRLGVTAKKRKNRISGKIGFWMVSCSNIIPLKRMELIVKALSLCTEFKVCWVHFGDGSSKEDIEKLSVERLTPIGHSFSFRGHVRNEEVMKFYEENAVDCFITTSATEGGCPLSIQEALAYGIPVIATAVGGIPECIRNNGVLLPENPSEEEVAMAISKIYHASKEEIISMRENSYQLWQERFDAEQNNKAFVKFLKESI